MFDSYISVDEGGNASRLGTGGKDAPITVFVNRAGFERGVSGMLSKGMGEGAVLHLSLHGEDGHTGSVSRRMLTLVGNSLRAAMRRGAAVYLGNAEFALFLHGTDAREAAAYARTVIQIIASLRVTWEHELLSAHACVGGVVAGDVQDGAALLEQAMAAGELAQGKQGCKLHMLHAHEQIHALRQLATANAAALLA